MAFSVIYFILIDFSVTLLMGNIYSTLDKIVKNRRNSLKDENKQTNTQKRKYQDFLDIVLSAQVSLSNSEPTHISN